MPLPRAALNLVITVLNLLPELHNKKCFYDENGKLEYKCQCQIRTIINKLLRIMGEEPYDYPANRNGGK